jgi:hypothetical protein
MSFRVPLAFSHGAGLGHVKSRVQSRGPGLTRLR